MTDEEILEIASNYLHYDVDGNKAYKWKGEPHELFKFARVIYDEGYNQSYNDSKNPSFKGFHNSLDG